MNKKPLCVAIAILSQAACQPLAYQADFSRAFQATDRKSTVETTPIEPVQQTIETVVESKKIKLINVSFHEVNARDFFMGLVIDSQENMVVHPEVSGYITMDLKNVTIEDVLEATKQMYGYEYKKTRIGYMIYPATLQTKIFNVDHLDMQREGNSITRVSSGQINNNRQNGMSGMNNLMGTQSGLAAGGGGIGNGQAGNQMFNQLSATNATSGSWINSTSKTDFWQELEKSLNTIIAAPVKQSMDSVIMSDAPGIAINKQTGMVVVKATPMQMRDIEKLINGTEHRISRQVVIETKILEVILDSGHQDGINWASVVRQSGQAMLTASNPLPSAIAQSANVFTLNVNKGDFSMFVHLMENQGKTNILSSPRISTLNNQKAVIKVGQDEYFITGVSSNNNTGISGSAVVNNDIQWTPFFSGIAMDVTPQIADNEKITLHIHPSITQVESQVKDFSINGQANSIPMALNKVRESDSIVNAESGQIIVIGGLMQEKRDETKRGVSLLSSLPYVGHLFREDIGALEKSELVILLKPTIIENNNWDEQLQEAEDKIKILENRRMWN